MLIFTITYALLAPWSRWRNWSLQCLIYLQWVISYLFVNSVSLISVRLSHSHFSPFYQCLQYQRKGQYVITLKAQISGIDCKIQILCSDISYMSLRYLFKFSLPHFSYLQNGNNNNCLIVLLYYVKPLEQYLAHTCKLYTTNDYCFIFFFITWRSFISEDKGFSQLVAPGKIFSGPDH